MDYRKDGFVSLWIGKVVSKDLLEKLLAHKYSEDGDLILSDFAKLFKTGRYDEDFREGNLFSDGIRNFSDLLKPFSYSDAFADSLLKSIDIAVKDGSLDTLNTIILLYNFKYTGNKREINNKQYGFLKFIDFARYDY